MKAYCLVFMLIRLLMRQNLTCSSIEDESEHAEYRSSCQRRCSLVLRKPRRRGFFMCLLPEHAMGAEVAGQGFE